MLMPFGFSLGFAANEAVEQSGGEQPNHHGPAGGAQVARLPLHRPSLGCFVTESDVWICM